MQGLSASCVQQRFALTRCCDSNDKKSRRRKTREERRTMVESFINKYRTSNNGKFPSLNLTHKEVGGSFYIVREIVRDIIQENRVLGPGSPSMKALTLEDSLEEHESEYFSMNPQRELFESSIGLAVDEKQIEISCQDSDELVKSDNEEIFASDQNNLLFFSQVLQHGPNHFQQNSSDANEHENSVTIESKEVNVRKPSLHTHDRTEIIEESSSEVQGDLERSKIHKVEQPKPLCETLSIISAEEGLVLNKDVESNCSCLAETTNMSTENSGTYRATGAGALPEEKGFVTSATTSEHLFTNLVSSEEEFSSFVPSATKTDSELTGLRRDNLIGTQESLSIQNSPNEQEEPSMQIDELSILNGTEVIENTFSSLGDEVTNPTLLVSQSSLSPSSGTLQTEASPVPQVCDMEGAEQKIECASAESLSPSVQEHLKDEHETDGGSVGMVSCSSSKSANANEEIQSKANPVWNAIKAFVTTLIKFWTE